MMVLRVQRLFFELADRYAGRVARTNVFEVMFRAMMVMMVMMMVMVMMEMMVRY